MTQDASRLSQLPVEILLLIAEHLKTSDILHLTRTCVSLRQISLYNHAMWRNAQDADSIPLPPGTIISEINPVLLPRYAKRQESLSLRWGSSSSIDPIRVARPAGLKSSAGDTQWLLPGGDIVVATARRALYMSSLSKHFNHIFSDIHIFGHHTPPAIGFWSPNSQTAGKIIMAVMAEVPNPTSRSMNIPSVTCLFVYQITQTELNVRIVRTHRFYLPEGSCFKNVCGRNDLVVLSNGNGLIFFDLSTSTGVWMRQYNPDDRPFDYIEMEVVKSDFHPSHATFLLDVYVHLEKQVLLASIPIPATSQMSPVDQSLTDSDFGWTVLPLDLSLYRVAHSDGYIAIEGMKNTYDNVRSMHRLIESTEEGLNIRYIYSAKDCQVLYGDVTVLETTYTFDEVEGTIDSLLSLTSRPFCVPPFNRLVALEPDYLFSFVFDKNSPEILAVLQAIRCPKESPINILSTIRIPLLEGIPYWTLDIIGIDDVRGRLVFSHGSQVCFAQF